MSDIARCPRCGGHEFTADYEEHDKGDHMQITAALICETCPEDVHTEGPRVESLINDDQDALKEAIRAWNAWAAEERLKLGK